MYTEHSFFTDFTFFLQNHLGCEVLPGYEVSDHYTENLYSFFCLLTKVAYFPTNSPTAFVTHDSLETWLKNYLSVMVIPEMRLLCSSLSEFNNPYFHCAHQFILYSGALNLNKMSKQTHTK